MEQRISAFRDASRELDVLTTLILRPEMAMASGETLARYIDDAQGQLARLRGPHSAEEVCHLVSAGLQLHSAVSGLLLARPALATAHVEALNAGLIAALQKHLLAAEPGLEHRANDVERDVCIRACLELNGIAARDCRRLRGPGRPKDAALDEAVAAWGRSHFRAVVCAAYVAAEGRWPEYGYPTRTTAEGVRLLRTLQTFIPGGPAAGVENRVLYLRLVESG